MYFYHFSDEKLDIDSIIEKIVVSSIYGKDAKVNMKPFFGREALEKELELIESVFGDFRHKKLVFTKIRNVLKGMKEIRGTLKRLSEGSILSEIELFELKKFVLNIRLICQITDSIKTLPEELLPERLTSVEEILDPKNDGIPTYHIYDEYSLELKTLRKKIEKIENVLMQDKKILINELSIKYGLKIRPNGEFRISKSSGAVESIRSENHFKYVSEEYGLYIYQVDFDHSHHSQLKLLSEYHLLEQQEEERIKIHLSHELKKYILKFETNINRISHLDLIIGKVAFAIGYNLVRPIITEDNEIDILQGVNIPVSDRLKRDGMNYTPIDIKVRRGTSIITGSNMGGKTVTLKLIGQITAMAQLGLFVPARKAKISLRDYIYISVGDHQSIDLGLSSFASEMVTLSEIIDQSHLNGLILVDELSRGTNPQEGYAISRSITDYLNEKESICVFTSHFDGITQGKVHFQVRGLKNLNFESLSSGYSVIETLHQQMDYTLEKVNDFKQVPKEAIPISEILGLNEWIITRAKQYLIHEKEGKKMKNKLNLDFKLIEEARASAKSIAIDIQEFIEQHTSVTVERTIIRLFGVDGVDDYDRPLPNVVVDKINNQGKLALGISYYMGNAIVATGKSPQEIAEMVASDELDIVNLPAEDFDKVRATINEIALKKVLQIKEVRETREKFLKDLGEGPKPYLYVIVATGNIYEDVNQAKAAARQGADIIAVIRSTAQSLLDYVPYGPTTEGFGGTFATQENFRIMRKALDEVGEEVGKYIRLVNYCSGLCMPEIAAMGAVERLDVMLNDALYGILFRDINMQRTLVDQFFSRVINGFAGIMINTGEDNYLTTSDAYEEAHTVLASQFINEQFAILAGLKEEQMGLGHAFEMNPKIENGFLYELSQAQMARDIFPNAPLKYMPPTKYMTGNIFKGHVQDALFNMIAITTNQGIQLLGMLTEAIHTPLMQDRALSIENAKYVFNNMRNFGDEIEFKKDGIIQSRAQGVLKDATQMIKNIEREGLMETIAQGKFAGVKRAKDGGKGLAGVVIKDEMYFNPFIEMMLGGEYRD